MRKALVVVAVSLFLWLGCGPLAGADVLRPSSKHPAPADQSPSADELKALAELEAEEKAAADKAAAEKAAQEKAAETQTASASAGEKSGQEQPAQPQAGQSPPPPPGQSSQGGSGQPPQPGSGQPPQGKPDQAQEKKEPQAASKPGKSPSLAAGAASDEPIKIVSNRLEADDKAMTVTFTGQVKAVQGETTLWCDKMVVHYTKEGSANAEDVGTGNRQIRKIEVFGHVKVTKQDKTGTGQQGLYELVENRVVLWGKARLTQGKNTIDGDKVILYLSDDRAIVEGGPKKVEAILVPEKKEPPKPSKPGGQG